MSLPVPYLVYGYIYEDGSPVEDAIVHAEGTVTTVSTTSDASGKYKLNLQTCADDGDSVEVRAFYNGKYNNDTFTLDVGSSFKQINLTVAAQIYTDTITSTDIRLKQFASYR
jgi:hypothetical protein